MKLEEFIEKRMKRTLLIVEMATKKIVKKELKKFKKDIIKGALENGRGKH